MVKHHAHTNTHAHTLTHKRIHIDTHFERTHSNGTGWKEWRTWRLDAARDIGQGGGREVGKLTSYKSYEIRLTDSIQCKVLSLGRKRQNYLACQREVLAAVAIAFFLWQRVGTERGVALVARAIVLIERRRGQRLVVQTIRWWRICAHSCLRRRQLEQCRENSVCFWGFDKWLGACCFQRRRATILRCCRFRQNAKLLGACVAPWLRALRRRLLSEALSGVIGAQGQRLGNVLLPLYSIAWVKAASVTRTKSNCFEIAVKRWAATTLVKVLQRWKSEAVLERVLRRILHRCVGKQEAAQMSRTFSTWKEEFAVRKIARHLQTRHFRRWLDVSLMRALRAWKEYAENERISKQVHARSLRRWVGYSLKLVWKCWQEETTEARFERAARQVHERALRRWLGYSFNCVFGVWKEFIGFERVSRQVEVQNLRRQNVAYVARVFARWQHNVEFERTSRVLHRRLANNSAQRILRCVVANWKCESHQQHIFKLMVVRQHTGVLRNVLHVMRVQLYRMCRVNHISNRHAWGLLRQVIIAWCWRRELTRMMAKRSRRTEGRLQNTCLCRWEEIIIDQKRTRRLFGLCFQFQLRSSSSDQCACFLGWLSVTKAAKTKLRALRQWPGCASARSFATWKEVAGAEKVSRQVCARTVRIGSRKLLQAALCTWKDVWMDTTLIQKGQQKHFMCLQSLVLCEWHESVKAETCRKHTYKIVSTRHARAWLRQVLISWSWRRELACINLRECAKSALMLQHTCLRHLELVLCEWQSAVKRALYTKTAKRNMSTRHTRAWQQHIFKAWCGRRKLARILYLKSERMHKVLLDTCVRRWEEMTDLQKRAKQLHGCSNRFRSKMQIVEQSFCFVGWITVSHACKLYKTLASKAFARRLRHVLFSAIMVWKEAKQDIQVCEQQCARAVRICENKLRTCVISRWKEACYELAVCRKFVCRHSVRSKIRIMCEWFHAMRAHQYRLIVKQKLASRRARMLLWDCMRPWCWMRDLAKQDQRKLNRLSRLDRRRTHHCELKLQRRCVVAWEEAIMKRETLMSRTLRIDALVQNSQLNIENGEQRAFFLAWARASSLIQIRKKGFTRAKRQWIGYSTRAVLSRFFDLWRDEVEHERVSRQMCAQLVRLGSCKLLAKSFDHWRDDAESQRVSRQVCTRSERVQSRKLMLRIVEIWTRKVVDSSANKKSEQILSHKIRIRSFGILKRVMSEWRAMSKVRLTWRRKTSRLQSKCLRMLMKCALFTWQATVGSNLYYANPITILASRRSRSLKLYSLLVWRWRIDDVNSLLSRTLQIWQRWTSVKKIMTRRAFWRAQRNSNRLILRWVDETQRMNTKRNRATRLMQMSTWQQRKVRTAKTRLNLLAWYILSRESVLHTQISKTVSRRVLCMDLKENFTAWADLVGGRVFSNHRARSHFARKCRLRSYIIWAERVFSLKQRKLCKFAAARKELLVSSRLKSRMLRTWNAISMQCKMRWKLCVFFEKKCGHHLKSECFAGWIGNQTNQRDLLRRVQFESEAAERKLRADMEMCQRMLERYNWHRYERQISTAFVGWHVYCVNLKHIKTVDHMFFKKHSDEAKKRFFSDWAQQRRFSRLRLGFVQRSSRRKSGSIFFNWKRNSTREESKFLWLERTFSFKIRIKLELALLRWQHVATASKPMLRANLCRVKFSRWYRSLLLRIALRTWEDHVREGQRIIHTNARIKLYHVCRWRRSMRRRKRVSQLEAYMNRHHKKLAMLLKSSALKAWTAAKARNARLKKAQRLWCRHTLSKVLKIWKVEVVFERMSRQACSRYVRRSMEQCGGRVWKEWRKETTLNKIQANSDRVGNRKLRFSSFEAWSCAVLTIRYHRKVSAGLAQRSKTALKRRFLAACWQTVDVLRKIHHCLLRCAARKQERLRLGVFRAWRVRRDYASCVEKLVSSIAVHGSISVRKNLLMWFVHVREHVQQRKHLAIRSALRMHAKFTGDCFGHWCDLTKAGQMQGAINSLITHTVDTLTNPDSRANGIRLRESKSTLRVSSGENTSEMKAQDLPVSHRISLFAISLAARLFCRGGPFEGRVLAKTELFELAADAAKVQQVEMQNAALQDQLVSFVKQTNDSAQELQTDFDNRLLLSVGELEQLRVQMDAQSKGHLEAISGLHAHIEIYKEAHTTAEKIIETLVVEVADLEREMDSVKAKLTGRLNEVAAHEMALATEMMEKDWQKTATYEQIVQEHEDEYEQMCSSLASTEMDLDMLQQVLVKYEEQRVAEIKEKAAFEANMLERTEYLENELLARGEVEADLQKQLDAATKYSTASVHRALHLSKDVEVHTLHEQRLKQRETELQAVIVRRNGEYDLQVSLLTARCCELEQKMQEEAKKWVLRVMASDSEQQLRNNNYELRCRMLEAKVEETGNQWEEKCAKQVSELQTQNGQLQESAAQMQQKDAELDDIALQMQHMVAEVQEKETELVFKMAELEALELDAASSAAERGASLARKQKELLQLQHDSKHSITQLQEEIEASNMNLLAQADSMHRDMQRLSDQHLKQSSQLAERCAQMEDRLQDSVVEGVEFAEQVAGLEAQRQFAESAAREGLLREAQWLQQLDETHNKMTSVEHVMATSCSKASNAHQELTVELARKNEEIRVVGKRHAEAIAKLVTECDIERENGCSQRTLVRSAADESRLQRRLLTGEVERLKGQVAVVESDNDTLTAQLDTTQSQLALSREQLHMTEAHHHSEIAGFKREINVLKRAADDNCRREARLLADADEGQQEVHRSQLNEGDMLNRIQLLEAAIDRQKAHDTRQQVDLKYQEEAIKSAIGAPPELDLSLVAPIATAAADPPLFSPSKMAVYAKVKFAADAQAMYTLQTEVEQVKQAAQEAVAKADARARAAEENMNGLAVMKAEAEGQLSVLRESTMWLQDQLNAERTKNDTIVAAHSLQSCGVIELEHLSDRLQHEKDALEQLVHQEKDNMLRHTERMLLELQEERERGMLEKEELQQLLQRGKETLEQESKKGEEAKRENEDRTKLMHGLQKEAESLQRELEQERTKLGQELTVKEEMQRAIAEITKGRDVSQKQVEGLQKELHQERETLENELLVAQGQHVQDFELLQIELANLKMQSKEQADDVEVRLTERLVKERARETERESQHLLAIQLKVCLFAVHIGACT